MSYVIQNFYDCNRKITTTPRFKFLFFLINLEKFFIFLKFNNFLSFNKKPNSFFLDYFFVFIKYFFSKNYIKMFNNLNLEYVGTYLNNLTKSYIYHIFKNIDFFLNFSAPRLEFNLFKNEYFYNSYFFSIKTINTRINNRLFKNSFFFLMLSMPYIWYQHSSFIRFYLNFILVNYNLKIARFYNGYFLRIYNF